MSDKGFKIMTNNTWVVFDPGIISAFSQYSVFASAISSSLNSFKTSLPTVCENLIYIKASAHIQFLLDDGPVSAGVNLLFPYCTVLLLVLSSFRVFLLFELYGHLSAPDKFL